MNDIEKKKLEELLNSSEVISNYLIQQVQSGAINQMLYVKNIQRFVEALNDFKAVRND